MYQDYGCLSLFSCLKKYQLLSWHEPGMYISVSDIYYLSDSHLLSYFATHIRSIGHVLDIILKIKCWCLLTVWFVSFLLNFSLIIMMTCIWSDGLHVIYIKCVMTMNTSYVYVPNKYPWHLLGNDIFCLCDI